jgi:hypothetical protein
MARKVEAPIDWRSQFQESPTLFLAAAVGGGLLIGMATNALRSHPAPERREEVEPEPEPARKSLRWDWSDSIGVVKSVLIGIAITQAKKVLVNQMANHGATRGSSEHPAPSAARTKAPPDSTTH